MLILGVQKIESTKYVKLYRYSAIPVILLVLVLKVHILFQLVDIPKDRTNDFRGNKEFVQQIFTHIDERPTVAGRYQMAGLLSFYGPEQVIVPSVNYNYRYNHFALLQIDTTYYGKSVNYVDKWVKGDTVMWHNELVRVGEVKDYKGFEIKEK